MDTSKSPRQQLVTIATINVTILTIYIIMELINAPIATTNVIMVIIQVTMVTIQ